MPSLTPEEIADLLQLFLPSPAQSLLKNLSQYLELLLKWNARTNLTAIRDPAEIVQRHFGESLYTATQLGNPTTLLDYGTGAGFPGLPIALLRPDIHVTLAESQNKKVAFLREAVRTLHLPVDIWPKRVEDLPTTQQFDTVTLRAVDDMTPALLGAAPRSRHQIAILTTTAAAQTIQIPEAFTPQTPLNLPQSTDRILLQLTRTP